MVVEGSMGDAIFLLYDGELLVPTLDAGGRDITLAQVNSQGAFFGGFADAQAVILRNIARVSAQRLRESNVLVASIASDSSSA